MSQHDYVIDNGPGLAVRTDLNAAVKALASTNAGPVQPATRYAGQLWLDTSTSADGILRIRNAGNTAWLGLSADIGRLTGVPTPTVTDEVASKGYVDTAIAGGVASGGTVTGDIVIETASPDLALKRTASSQGCTITGMDEAGNVMWRNFMGSGTGKDWLLYRYNSSGVQVDSPLWVDWAAGHVTIDNGLTVNGGGITVAAGGLLTDNITQEQSSSTATLSQTVRNSSGYIEWQWRMDGTSKQYDLRCFNGLSSGTLIGIPITCRSSDGKINFAAGVYGRIDVDIAGEGIALVGPGATDSPYISWYQGATRRAYVQFHDTAGFKIVNDQSNDHLVLDNGGSVDALRFYDDSVGNLQPIYHHGNAFYTGSSNTNTSFSVGSYLCIKTTSAAANRNASQAIFLDSDARAYNNSSGTAVAGTWRARGHNGGPELALMQRTA